MLPVVSWLLLAAGGVLLWAGLAVLLDEWMARPRRRRLADRLQPYAVSAVAEEAEEWLTGR